MSGLCDWLLDWEFDLPLFGHTLLFEGWLQSFVAVLEVSEFVQTVGVGLSERLVILSAEPELVENWFVFCLQFDQALCWVSVFLEVLQLLWLTLNELSQLVVLLLWLIEQLQFLSQFLYLHLIRMPIQLNPFQGPHLQRHLIQVLCQSLNLCRLEQADQFQVVTHKSRWMFGKSCNHALTNVVWVSGDLHVPQDCASISGFLLAHFFVGTLLRTIGLLPCYLFWITSFVYYFVYLVQISLIL